jgi:hypothetical protein
MNDIDHRRLERALWKPIPVTVEVTLYKYWHKISSPHLRGLVKLASAVQRYRRPVDRYEAGVGADGSEYGNFAALRWWRLTEPAGHNQWAVTRRGWEFISDTKKIPERVLTLKNVNTGEVEVIGESVGLCSFRKLADSATWEKADYLVHRIAISDRDLSPTSLFAHLLTQPNT